MNSKRKITADAKSISEVLQGPVTYSVPANQRDFAWKTEDQVDTLWDDLTTALDEGRDEYFLGAIVVRPTAGQNSFEIVDGQQRITALSMIFAAIRTQWGEDGRSEEVAGLYLGSKDRRSRETIAKLRLNETNDPVFQAAVLDSQTPPQLAMRVKTNQLLVAAYQRIRAKLAEWCAQQASEEDALIAIEDFVAKNANLIVIQVEDESAAFVIFETLNDRGLELAVSDLVKNYLFSQAGASISQFKAAWEFVAQAVGNENLTPFLRHYWLSENDVVRERELYRALRETIKGPTKPKRFLQNLQKAADYYAALAAPDHAYWSDVPGQPQQHIRTLRLLRATQFRPLALAVMDGGTEQEVASMLRIVLAVSLRYIVSGASANELERTYSNAAVQIRKSGKRNYQSVKDALKSIYIPDDAFIEAFAEYQFSKADIARYVLAELNQCMATDKATGISDAVSLEHIMPRNPSSAWRSLPPADELDAWVERVGNLTLLDKGTNRKLGNLDFESKKTQALLPSKLPLNEQVKVAADWTTKEIDLRSKRLAKLAAQIWRLD